MRHIPRATTTTVVGIGAFLAGAVVVVGAFSPWVHVSLFTTDAHLNGTDSHLLGSYALALGVAGGVLGVFLVLAPSPGLRRMVALTLAAVGVAGVLLVRHEKHELKNNRLLNGLGPLRRYLGVHAGSSWGLWLDLGGFCAFVVLAVLAALTRAQPSVEPVPDPTPTEITLRSS